jgi:xylulokinase
MEGVAFGLRDSIELMPPSMGLGEVRVSGGGAESDTWMRIIASVLGRPVRRVGTAESAAHGAALLAATGAGAFATVDEACAASVALGPVIEPVAGEATLDEAYAVYTGLYDQLRETFARLSALDG